MSTFNLNGKIVDSFRTEAVSLSNRETGLKKTSTISATATLSNSGEASGIVHFFNASAAVTLTLPAAVAGWCATIIVQATTTATIDFALADSTNNKIVKSEVLADSYNAVDVTSIQLPIGVPAGSRISIDCDGSKYYIHVQSSSAVV